jgi:hypothetical protein
MVYYELPLLVCGFGNHFPLLLSIGINMKINKKNRKIVLSAICTLIICALSFQLVDRFYCGGERLDEKRNLCAYISLFFNAEKKKSGEFPTGQRADFSSGKAVWMTLNKEEAMGLFSKALIEEDRVMAMEKYGKKLLFLLQVNMKKSEISPTIPFLHESSFFENKLAVIFYYSPTKGGVIFALEKNEERWHEWSGSKINELWYDLNLLLEHKEISLPVSNQDEKRVGKMTNEIARGRFLKID